MCCLLDLCIATVSLGSGVAVQGARQKVCCVARGWGGSSDSGLALTWVDDLHSGVGFRMLFMDDLCADLLGEDLKSERR